MTGEQLRAIRKSIPEIGKSGTKFGAVVGRRAETISAYETNQRPIPIEVANLATALDLFLKLAGADAFALLVQRLERTTDGN